MYADVPVGPNNPLPYSHPGDLIWEYQAHEYEEVFVGWDVDPYTGVTDAAFHYLVFPPAANWFWQGDFAEPGTTNIYWLSIQAKLDDPGLNYTWGWKTREHFFQDGAFTATESGGPDISLDGACHGDS